MPESVPAPPQPLLPESGGILEAGFRPFRVFAAMARKAMPAGYNPIQNAGALANLNFLAALVTGVLLLLWYKPSVHEAYSSVMAMEASPWLAGLIRSLHRYTSDACLLFAVLHGLENFFAKRFERPRWIAWITGIVLLAVLWLDGWLGYWLVWDDVGQRIAMQSARFVDLFPIFQDPLARSFLTPGTVNSLFFFVVFFIHMLIPMVFALGLWLHVSRLNQSRFFPTWRVSAMVLASITVFSLVWPARTGGPTDFGKMGAEFSTDILYLLPLWVENWVSPKGLLYGLLAAALALFSIPWVFGRKPRNQPMVNREKCGACTQCYQDCPFGAIEMVADENGLAKSLIDPAKCLACGNCLGSCTSDAISFADFALQNASERIETWFSEGRPPDHLLFACRNSAAGELNVEAITGLTPQLAGYRVIPVPCAGSVYQRLFEKAAECGARGVLIAACGSSGCHYRLGLQWAVSRMERKRKPFALSGKISGLNVAVAERDVGDLGGLVHDAEAFQRQGAQALAGKKGLPKSLRWAPAASVAALFALVIAGLNRVPYSESETGSELVVSFRHAGGYVTPKAHPDDGGKAKKDDKVLPHMRAQAAVAGKRERVPVRLRILVDGQTRAEKSFRPRGLFKDLASVAIERVSLTPGKHSVSIQIGDTENPGEWTRSDLRVLDFKAGRREVILFQGKGGFQWP